MRVLALLVFGTISLSGCNQVCQTSSDSGLSNQAEEFMGNCEESVTADSTSSTTVSTTPTPTEPTPTPAVAVDYSQSKLGTAQLGLISLQ